MPCKPTGTHHQHHVDDHHYRPSRELSKASDLGHFTKAHPITGGPLATVTYDGRIELDSNIVERAIRPQTITRKNSLFAGSDGGGRTWAIIASLIQTARMNGVNPQAWRTQTLQRIADGWTVSRLDELMPWNFKPDKAGA